MAHAGSQAVSPGGGRRWPGRLMSRPLWMGKACKPWPLSPMGHPPLWAGLTQPGQGLGAKSTGPEKEALSPRPTQMPCQGPQPAGVVAAGTSRLRKSPTSRLPSVSRLGPLALRGQFLDCVPLGPFLWTACLSPFKPPNRDPQAVACEQQVLTSQLRRPRVRGQPHQALARVSSQRPGSSRHLLDTRPGSLQWPRSKVSEAGWWTPLRRRLLARSSGINLASQLPM